MRAALAAAIVLLASCGGPPPQAIEAAKRTSSGQATGYGPAIGLVGLHAALAAGDLVLTDIRGNGASSGAVLDGSLRNTTARSIRVGVRLSRALYLANRTAAAQNMLATAIYERGGQYWVENDGEPFIEVPRGQAQAVTLNGYCLDFELDNPAATDSLVAQQVVPPDLLDIADKLLAYEQDGEDPEHSVVRAQVALWLAQGHAPEEIQERFPFTQADLTEAYRVVAGAF